MKNNRFLLIFLLTICLLYFFLIIVGHAEKGFINYEKYKKIENKITNYQITKNQLVNKLGAPKYDLFLELPGYNFYPNILVYETRQSDLSTLLIVLRVKEDEGNKIDPNVSYLKDEKDVFFLRPDFGMELESFIAQGRGRSEKIIEINSLTKSCEEIITYINTSTGDDYMDIQGEILNKKYLSIVKSYKNLEKGYLIIVFNLLKYTPITASFLIRLFDRNGNYLNHFATEEIFRLFQTAGSGIEEINPLILVYNINSILLPEIKYLEFGLIIP